MKIDLAPFEKVIKKGLRVKTELERVDKAEKRIYELSRMLPGKEGFELLNIHKQSIEDTKKICKVFNEN